MKRRDPVAGRPTPAGKSAILCSRDLAARRAEAGSIIHPGVAMNLTLEQAIGQKLLVAFEGMTLPPAMADLLARQHLGGVTFFRPMNIDHPAQVRELTAALQQAAARAGQPPLLIATDQEGGQLMALAGTTPFPGNMALGATGSPDLAR